MAHYKIGIPQLTWVYVEVEIDGTDSRDPEYALDDEELQELAIEKAYDEAKKHQLCANCQSPYRGNWYREVDELGSLVDSKITLELDIIKSE